jgi:hypothetical protein
MAITCSMCHPSTFFCGWCQTEFANDKETHAHVLVCKYNAAQSLAFLGHFGASLFADEDQFREGTNLYKRHKLSEFLARLEQPIRGQVAEHIKDLMKEIGLVHTDVALGTV